MISELFESNFALINGHDLPPTTNDESLCKKPLRSVFALRTFI
ncbi:Uncharacterized protein dnm_046850 [Desulfonema magnum]|uniref:Uncharacterized protein n=1 Tax=Desulfonema magnum TaxID=45655 RepID=A0A975BNV5_9BACT|nr:Uncharacterized protein dnm_046850 [Desulfonema magnum]